MRCATCSSLGKFRTIFTTVRKSCSCTIVYYDLRTNFRTQFDLPTDLFCFLGAMADFQMTFPEGAAADYARLYGVFPNDLTTLCACFWFKLLKYSSGIFAYSSRLDVEEFTAYLYSSYSLDFYVGGRKAYIDT